MVNKKAYFREVYRNMIWKKYLVIGFGIFASVVIWWKVLTTPDIPSPIFQGVIFSLIMAFFVWFLLGFPMIKRKSSNRAENYSSETVTVKSEKVNSNKKLLLITLTSIIGVILIVGSMICFISLMLSPNKIPATPDEVWAAIEKQGYEPTDYTDSYYEADLSFQLSLKECIAFESDDIHFEFFEFNSKEDAVDIWGQAYQKITLKYNSVQKIEIENYIANYRIYTLDSLGKYNVAIYVGNTAVYAYCNSENKNEINKILDAIDYLRPGNHKETTT